MTVTMTTDVLRQISAHAAAELPNECCGLLVGTFGPQQVQVSECHRAANVWEGERTHRFQIDPLAHLRLQRSSRERGVEIVGSYHSHPQGEPVPSAFDAEAAWPDLCYLIVAPASNGPDKVRCWRLDEPTGRFVEAPLDVV